MEETHFIDKEPNRYEALAELQRQEIQSMNEDEVMQTIGQFEHFWDLKTNDYRNARELGYRQFIHKDNWDTNNNPDPMKIDILAIKNIREKQRRYLVELKNRMVDLHLDKTEANEDGTTLMKRLNNVLKQLKDGYENIRRHHTSFERVTNPTALPQVTS